MEAIMQSHMLKKDDPTLPDGASLYANENDRLRHLAYIAALAQQNHRPIPEIADFYERILSDLRQHAKVHDYLNVFVAKKVFEQLKRSD
jgi:hypothetical protein